MTAVVAVLAFVLAAPAAATTICVPSFTAACPNSGGNKAEPIPEKAMSTEAADGKADQIYAFKAWATDAAGNKGPTLATRKLRVPAS